MVTFSTVIPVKTLIPSCSNKPWTSSETSLSSLKRSLSTVSPMVTLVPNLEKIWANSQPTALPPNINKDLGSSFVAPISLKVTKPASFRPSIGGMKTVVPVAIKKLWAEWVFPFASTS